MASVTNTFTDSIAISYTGNGKAVTVPVGSYTGAKDAGVATVIVAGGSLEIDVAFPYATIQAFVMASTQDVTVKVNSSSSPVDTFNLKKTAGMVWAPDFVGNNPFTVDVTALHVSNSGSTDAAFNLRVLYN